MFKNFLPKEEKFFDLFERHATLVVQSAERLHALFQMPTVGGPSQAIIATQIRAFEHEADIITHQTVEWLHKTFITPFDRDLIFHLISRMDDVIDNIDAAADDLLVYKIVEIRAAAEEMAKILLAATKELKKAVTYLGNLKNSDLIRAACVAVNQYENDADLVLRNAIGKLFEEETDTRTLIKWKDIYESLEEAIDRCEDVANVIEGIILESS